MFGKIRAFFKNRKAAADRAILTTALSGKWEFRSLTALAKKIGTTDTTYLHGLLDAIGTRSMYGNPDMVGLTARIGERPRRYADLHN